MNQDEMYEEYGKQSEYPSEITCQNCKKTIAYAGSNLDAVTEEIIILCRKCKEKLP